MWTRWSLQLFNSYILWILSNGISLESEGWMETWCHATPNTKQLLWNSSNQPPLPAPHPLPTCINDIFRAFCLWQHASPRLIVTFPSMSKGVKGVFLLRTLLIFLCGMGVRCALRFWHSSNVWKPILALLSLIPVSSGCVLIWEIPPNRIDVYVIWYSWNWPGQLISICEKRSKCRKESKEGTLFWKFQHHVG